MTPADPASQGRSVSARATAGDALDDPVVALSRERIEKGSKSFAVAARLFTPDVRASAYMLYAWCRYCDDVADGQELGFSPGASQPGAGELADVAVASNAAPGSGFGGARGPADAAQIADLRRRTVAACRGAPDDAIFEALSRVVARHEIPQVYPLDLIEGFAMDASGRRYETLADTLLYCYHVAGVVGLMMAHIMGVRDRATLCRAVDLGIAFQLTNIARDVLDDAAAGRLYLPLDWLREVGVSEASVAHAATREKVAAVTVRLLKEADRYYDSALVGSAALPFRSAMAIAAARGVYRGIGREVRRRGARAWDTRVSTSTPFKLGTVALSPVAVILAKWRYTGIFGKDGQKQPPRTGLWTHPALAAPGIGR